MSINGKRDNFSLDDLLATAKAASIKERRAAGIINQVAKSVQKWPEFASEAQVPELDALKIQSTHRTLTKTK